MDLTHEMTEKGVTERSFTLDRPQEPVPGLLWTPEAPPAAAPGADRPRWHPAQAGAQHPVARPPPRAPRGPQWWPSTCPTTATASPPRSDLPREAAPAPRRRVFGGDARSTTDQAVADWKAVLDAAQRLPEVGAGPVGYWGCRWGPTSGSPWWRPSPASRPRCSACSVGPRAPGWPGSTPWPAASPFRCCSSSSGTTRWRPGSAMTLFDLFGSADKCLHANPGRHVEIPMREAAGRVLRPPPRPGSGRRGA